MVGRRWMPLAWLAVLAFVFGGIPATAQSNIPDGQLVRRSDDAIFLIQGGQKYRVYLFPLDDATINALPDGPPALSVAIDTVASTRTNAPPPPAGGAGATGATSSGGGSPAGGAPPAPAAAAPTATPTPIPLSTGQGNQPGNISDPRTSTQGQAPPPPAGGSTGAPTGASTGSSADPSAPVDPASLPGPVKVTGSISGTSGGAAGSPARGVLYTMTVQAFVTKGGVPLPGAQVSADFQGTVRAMPDTDASGASQGTFTVDFTGKAMVGGTITACFRGECANWEQYQLN